MQRSFVLQNKHAYASIDIGVCALIQIQIRQRKESKREK